MSYCAISQKLGQERGGKRKKKEVCDAGLRKTLCLEIIVEVLSNKSIGSAVLFFPPSYGKVVFADLSPTCIKEESA